MSPVKSLARVFLYILQRNNCSLTLQANFLIKDVAWDCEISLLTWRRTQILTQLKRAVGCEHESVIS